MFGYLDCTISCSIILHHSACTCHICSGVTLHHYCSLHSFRSDRGNLNRFFWDKHCKLLWMYKWSSGPPFKGTVYYKAACSVLFSRDSYWQLSYFLLNSNNKSVESMTSPSLNLTLLKNSLSSIGSSVQVVSATETVPLSLAFSFYLNLNVVLKVKTSTADVQSQFAKVLEEVWINKISGK